MHTIEYASCRVNVHVSTKAHPHMHVHKLKPKSEGKLGKAGGWDKERKGQTGLHPGNRSLGNMMNRVQVHNIVKRNLLC